MATLHPSQIDDLVKSTLEDWGDPNFQMIAQSLQNLIVMKEWLKSNHMMTQDGGKSIKRNLMLRRGTGVDRNFMFASDTTDVPTLLSTTTMEWTHLHKSYGYDYKESLINTGKAMVTEVLEPRRADCMLAIAEGLENDAWTLRDATDPQIRPNGIPYYVVAPSSYTAGGFTGGNPSGHSSCAGIDASSDTYANWRNYHDQYVAITRTDWLPKIRTMLRKINFVSPITPKQYWQFADTYCLYTDEATINEIETMLDGQNDNLGSDVAKYMGTATVKRHPVIWVPQLDASTVPLYGRGAMYAINHSMFKMIVLAGDNMRQTGPFPAANQHDVREVHLDLSYNYLCLDRRVNGVICKSA